MNDKRISEAVHVLRRRAKMSQEELGKAAGLHRNTISAIENGDLEVKLSTLIAIFEALGFELEINLKEKDVSNGSK